MLTVIALSGLLVIIVLASVFSRVFAKILGGFAIVLGIIFMIFLMFWLFASILGFWRGIFGFLFC